MLEIFTTRKPIDEIFQQGLNLKKYALEVQANQISGIVEAGLSNTYSSELKLFIRSSGISDHSSKNSTISIGRIKVRSAWQP